MWTLDYFFVIDFLYLGARDLLGKLAAVDCGNNNSTRNVMRLIAKTDGMSLALPIDSCVVRVKYRKPVRVVREDWPIIRLQTWVTYMLNVKPEMILGGYQVSDPGWQSMLLDFWNTYRSVDADHPAYRDYGDVLSTVVPVMLHGDEGRGLHHRPYMVISMQPVIAYHGPHRSNEGTLRGLYFKV